MAPLEFVLHFNCIKLCTFTHTSNIKQFNYQGFPQFIMVTPTWIKGQSPANIRRHFNASHTHLMGRAWSTLPQSKVYICLIIDWLFTYIDLSWANFQIAQSVTVRWEGKVNAWNRITSITGDQTPGWSYQLDIRLTQQSLLKPHHMFLSFSLYMEHLE